MTTAPALTVTVTPVTALLTVGDTTRLRAQSIPNPCGCRWRTADPSVAVIDATGLVRAMAPGRAIITVSLERYPEVSSSALIEVTAP